MCYRCAGDWQLATILHCSTPPLALCAHSDYKPSTLRAVPRSHDDRHHGTIEQLVRNVLLQYSGYLLTVQRERDKVSTIAFRYARPFRIVCTSHTPSHTSLWWTVLVLPCAMLGMSRQSRIPFRDILRRARSWRLRVHKAGTPGRREHGTSPRLGRHVLIVHSEDPKNAAMPQAASHAVPLVRLASRFRGL